MDILQVTNLVKHFGGVKAVNGVDFELRQGEILGLIGPNGSGKTTVFNLISGVYKADGGKIIFNGDNITGLPPAKVCQRGIVRTFQIPRPFASLSVLENIHLGCTYGSNPVKDLKASRAKAREILAFIELEEFSNTKACDLRLLNRKRLELGKALAACPKVLMLDEVMGGLTPLEVASAMELIMKIRAEGVSIIVVEHLIRAIVGICDRALVLNTGCVIACGKPDEVVRDPEVISAYLGSAQHA